MKSFRQMLATRARSSKRLLTQKRRRRLLEPLEQRQLLAVDFVFDYVDIASDTDMGFDDPILGEQRRAALESSATTFGALFDHVATIDVDVDSEFSGSDLASAGADFPTTTNDGFDNPSPVEIEILTGVDSNGAATEAGLTVNWANDFALGDTVGPGQHDFVATIMHELAHIVGFTSNILENGDSDITKSASRVWGAFDQFVSDSSGVSIIDSGGNIDLTRWDASKTAGTSGLFFNGPQAVAANGGDLVPLYSPSVFDVGSSVSHVDDDNVAIDATSFLLVSAGVPGVVNARTLHPIELAMFEDLGFTMLELDTTAPSAPTITITSDANNDGFVNNVEFGGHAPLANLFEDGTTQGWQHGSVSSNPPQNNTGIGLAGPDDSYLHFEGHGDGDAVDLSASRLAAFNRTEWIGDYIEQGITEITLDINNTGTRDLDLRLGIGRSPNSGRWVTPSQNLPVGSGWTTLTFSFAPDDLIGLIPGVEDPTNDLRSVGVLKFIENIAPVWSSTPAENVPGRTAVEVDNMRQSGTALNTMVSARIDLPADAEVGDMLNVSDESSTQVITLTPEQLGVGSVTLDFDSPGESHALNLSVTVSDAAGNVSEPATDSVQISTDLPVASILLDQDITADDVIDLTESQATIAITGTVDGDASAGDQVVVSANGNSYTGQVADENGTLRFRVDVLGSDLATDADSTVEAELTVIDTVGNSLTVSDSATYTVDTRPLPGFVIQETDGATTVSENATSDSFSVSLTRQPSTDVVVEISGVDDTEVSLDSTTLTFTSADWDIPQVVEVVGIDDLLVDGDVLTALSLSVSAPVSDDDFDGVDAAILSVTTSDNDSRTESTGSGQAFEVYQPTLGVSYVIATQGFLPNELAGGFGDGSTPVIGELRLFAGDTAPAGFAFASGQVLNIGDNSQLFSIIGDTFGGDGQTTFQLPDLRDRVAIGTSAAEGLSIGTVVGSSSVSLAVSQLPAHSHDFQDPAAGQTLNTGQGDAFSIRQPSLALNYIIDVVGSGGQVGAMTLFAGAFVPGDWALAEGQQLDIASNASLFAELGTTFGGDGLIQFSLPDLRGRSVVGSGSGIGLTPRSIGFADGSSDQNLTVDQIPLHDHDYSIGSSTASVGAGAAFSLLQPSLTLSYAILTSGVEAGWIGLRPVDTLPSPWLPADGRSLLVADHAELFAAIGTTYGGDGITEFMLPDLRGRLAAHHDPSGSISLGETLGAEVATLSVDELPAHDHAVGGIAIQQTGGNTSIIEGGSADSFSVSLVNAPATDVTLQLSLTDPLQGTLDTNSITFTAANWFEPQAVLVTPTADGDMDTSIRVQVDSSNSDVGYRDVADVLIDVSVLPVNDAPSFTATDPPRGLEDSGQQTINGFATFLAGAGSEAGQAAVEYVVSNVSDPSLFSASPEIDAAGNLTYTPADDANGSSTFDVIVQDDGGVENGGVDTSTQQTFTIFIDPVNDSPTLIALNPPGVDEDSGFQFVPSWANFNTGPSDESSQDLVRYSVSNVSNPSLFALFPEVDISGNLSYTLVFNASGSTTFDVVAVDDGGTDDGGNDTSETQTFTLVVDEVNDQPFFNASNPPTVDQTAGNQVINGWVTQFVPGPASESAQAVQEYLVSDISDSDLFSELPEIDADGTLRYTPSTTVSGSSTFTVRVRDDGGTANGGVDTSAPQTFTITTRQVDQFDFGDLPDPSFPSLLVSDGARHGISSLFLGATVDYEVDGSPSVLADGDGADEDGVVGIASIVSDASEINVASFQIVASEQGKLDAWIDFNNDGSFDHPAEHLWSGVSVDLVAGDNVVAFNVPSGLTSEEVASRFRVSSAGDLEPSGGASDGEVEDYRMPIVSASTGNVVVNIPSGTTRVAVDSGDVVVWRDGVEVSRTSAARDATLSITTTDQDDIIELGDLSASNIQLQIDAGGGDDTVRLIDADANFDFTTIAGVVTPSIEFLDIRGNGPNTLTLDEASVLAASDPSGPLVIFMDSDDQVLASSDQIEIVGTEVVDSAFVTLAELGDAQLRMSGAGWTNPLNRFDVNQSNSVEPIDALQIINELARRAFVVGDTVILVDPASLSEFPLRFYDVNRDGFLTPIDALQILNQMQRRNGAGESVMSVPVVPSSFDIIDEDDEQDSHEFIFAQFGNESKM